MKNIVVFTGAGISAESGLGTFRDSEGLWDKYKIEDVATPEAFQRNPKLVLDFYNIRRRQLLDSGPNEAHFALNKLEKKFNLDIITQNVDNLHEASGSSKVLHLHGNLMEAKSTVDNSIYVLTKSDLNIGDKCDKGGQLRPNVVWFGENVPNMSIAIQKVMYADIFLIIGTSLNVYPAASLIDYALNSKRIIIIDPNAESRKGVEIVREKASVGVSQVVENILSL